MVPSFWAAHGVFSSPLAWAYLLTSAFDISSHVCTSEAEMIECSRLDVLQVIRCESAGLLFAALI